jgi:hypothetical protein
MRARRPGKRLKWPAGGLVLLLSGAAGLAWLKRQQRRKPAALASVALEDEAFSLRRSHTPPPKVPAH